MNSRGMQRDLIDAAWSASAGAVDATTVTGLRAIVRRARGWSCEVRSVVLDDQSGKLHVPLLEKVDRRSPSGRVAAGGLILRPVEEVAIEGPARPRGVELGRVSLDPATRPGSNGPGGRGPVGLT